MVRIAIPEKAQNIIATIQAAGFEAYAVGGCVRDSILGREPQDWDITTSARPEQVKKLFPRTIDTGIKHGTITVMAGKEGFEVTTYRIDGKYEDSRHPSEVIFTPSLREDLRRRDFTINAMAYNDEAGLIDIFGGMEDIENKTIRCVGDARERFGEDALRIMRAIRFSAQLGYSIEDGTRSAICELAPTLRAISAERIQAELTKLLVSPHPEYLRKAYECGVTAIVLPEFDAAMNVPQNNPHHRYSVGEHTLETLKYVEPDKILRLAMLFHDVGKPAAATTDENGISHFHGHAAIGEQMTKDILRRLRFDNETIRVVCRLVLYHDYGSGVNPGKQTVRRAVNKVGEDIFPLLFPVKYADIMAQSEYQRQEKLDHLAQWKRLYEEIIEQQDCVSLKTLALTGKDLLEAGWKPGPGLGETLNALLELVLEDPGSNTKEQLLAAARQIKADAEK